MNNPFIQIHISILLFGLTAIFGALIDLPSLVIVWWRMIIATASILLMFKIVPHIRQVPKKSIRLMIAAGGILAIHWVLFFGSIKLANASIALICMATTSFFTAILDPILNKKQFRKLDLLMGLLMLPGIALVVQADKLGRWEGIVVGLLAAILAAFYAIFNKPLVEKINPFAINAVEFGAGTIILSIGLLAMMFTDPSIACIPTGTDWIYLILLALLCTTFAYYFFLKALRSLSAFTANFSVNLEPVYGVILAYFLLGDKDELATGFYWGGLLIVISIFLHPFLERRLSFKHAE